MVLDNETVVEGYANDRVRQGEFCWPVLEDTEVNYILGVHTDPTLCFKGNRRLIRCHGDGVHYKTSDKPKSAIYQELLPLVNSGKVELLENETLIRQLLNLERRTSRAGKDSIDHPPGAHDDIANSVAGSLVYMDDVSDFEIKTTPSKAVDYQYEYGHDF